MEMLKVLADMPDIHWKLNHFHNKMLCEYSAYMCINNIMKNYWFASFNIYQQNRWYANTYDKIRYIDNMGKAVVCAVKSQVR